MKENKAQMRGTKYLWHNLEYILAAVFFVIMLVALFIQVFFRFVLNNPIGWTEELAVTCFVMMVYIGSIGATRNDEHMKMEMVINLFGPKGRLVMLIIGDVVFAVANLILAYGIFTVSLNLKKYGMTTAMLHIPKWIPYMVLPICFVTMDFKLLQNIGKKIKKIKELDNPESASVNKSANQEGE